MDRFAGVWVLCYVMGFLADGIAHFTTGLLLRRLTRQYEIHQCRRQLLTLEPLFSRQCTTRRFGLDVTDVLFWGESTQNHTAPLPRSCLL